MEVDRKLGDRSARIPARIRTSGLTATSSSTSSQHAEVSRAARSDTLLVVPSLDYDVVIKSRRRGALPGRQLTRDPEQSLAPSTTARDPGPAGYQQAAIRPAELDAVMHNSLMARLEESEERRPPSRRPELYTSLTLMIAGADTVLRQINSGTGSVRGFSRRYPLRSPR